MKNIKKPVFYNIQEYDERVHLQDILKCYLLEFNSMSKYERAFLSGSQEKKTQYREKFEDTDFMENTE